MKTEKIKKYKKKLLKGHTFFRLEKKYGEDISKETCSMFVVDVKTRFALSAVRKFDFPVWIKTN